MFIAPYQKDRWRSQRGHEGSDLKWGDTFWIKQEISRQTCVVMSVEAADKKTEPALSAQSILGKDRNMKVMLIFFQRFIFQPWKRTSLICKYCVTSPTQMWAAVTSWWGNNPFQLLLPSSSSCHWTHHFITSSRRNWKEIKWLQVTQMNDNHTQSPLQ